MKLNPFTCITLLDPGFVQSINTVVEGTKINTSDGVILTFNPNTYSGGRNNLSPMELTIDPGGNIQYLIVYSSSATHRVVEANWDFIEGTFTQFDEIISDLAAGRALFQLLTRNLSGQVNAALYQITLTPLLGQPQTAQST